MGLALKCLEHVTAIGCGLAALSLGSLDPGLTALGVVSGAALLAQFKEHCAKHGLDEPELLSKMQMAVLREWDTVDQNQADRDAIVEADTAMRLYLPDCMLSREDLAASSISTEHYPKRAARLVADQLGERDASFAASPRPDDEESIQRRFAMAVMEQALKAAMDDPAYAARLMLDLVVAGNAAHAVTHEGLGAIKDDTARILELLTAGELGDRMRASTVDQRAFIELARTINLEVDDEGQALVELTDVVERLLALEATAELGTNYEALVDQALKRMADKAIQGDFDGAASDGSKAFAAWEERQEAERESGIALIEANIQQQVFRHSAHDAAQWVMRRLQLEAGNGNFAIEAIWTETDNWHSRGNSQGLNFDLSVAIELARCGLEIAKNADERGKTFGRLGHSQFIRGKRDGNANLLAEAVISYRLALKEYPEKSQPVEWAKCQNNLGNSLWAIGELRSDRDFLNEAATAYYSALTHQTKDEFPLLWGSTQHNLANALFALGVMENGDALLQESIAAYRAAHTACKEESDPDSWARIHASLGTALQTLGFRTNSISMMEDAVTSFESALTIWQKEQNPIDWALAMGNLGGALLAVANRKQSPQLLLQAHITLLMAHAVVKDGAHGEILKYVEGRLARVESILGKPGE